MAFARDRERPGEGRPRDRTAPDAPAAEAGHRHGDRSAGMTEHVDVLIIGAGLSGIGAAYHLQSAFPDRTYTILEAREAIGGTWDLFRYPGVRSDSDMQTLGYSFKPWDRREAIADGGSILDYINDTADEHGIRERVRFGHRVVHAAWS